MRNLYRYLTRQESGDDFRRQLYNDYINLINVYLSLRDPNNKEKYSGDDNGWELTENVLRKVAKEKKLKQMKKHF